MSKPSMSWFLLRCLCLSSALLSPLSAMAIEDGMIDIRPYVSATTMYDDNVFRLTDATQAKALFGTTAMSDSMVRADVGVNVGIRLSRQTFQLGLNVNETKFDRFKFLDYTGNTQNAAWNWQLGNHLSGVLSYNEIESAPGFSENRSTLLNIRTTTRKYASAYWQFHPSWSLFSTFEDTKNDNSSITSKVVNREDEALEAGVQFSNAADTKVSLSFRNTDSTFPERFGPSLFLFGDHNTQQELIANISWSPTKLSRISTRIANIHLDYPDHSNRNFEGLSQRWDFSYALTSNTQLALSAFKDVNPVDDLVSTFVQATGFGITPTWKATSKITVGGGLIYQNREYLGSSGVFSASGGDRQDQSRMLNFFTTYTPTRKTSLQLSYAGENRTSNFGFLSYKDNTFNATFKLNF